MKKLNLQQFAGGHSVTVYKDSHVTTATPSSDSDVQKNADVTLTLVFASLIRIVPSSVALPVVVTFPVSSIENVVSVVTV